MFNCYNHWKNLNSWYIYMIVHKMSFGYILICKCLFICFIQVGWSLYELRPPLGPPYLVWDYWYTLCTCWRKPQHWRHFQLGLCLLQVTFEHIFFCVYACTGIPITDYAVSKILDTSTNVFIHDILIDSCRIIIKFSTNLTHANGWKRLKIIAKNLGKNS